MQIDIASIEAELQELAQGRKVEVELNKSQGVATSLKETDKNFSISFNPNRFRSPKKFEEHLDIIREAIAWGN